MSSASTHHEPSSNTERDRRSAENPRRTRGVLAGGFRLGSISGIEIQIDWSLMVVFALLLFNLGAGVLPAWHPEWSLLLVWGTALGAAVAFFASVLAHELSHALMGRRHGIPVSRVTLFLFGGLAHMDCEPPSPKSEFLMAIVGPITSLAIGFIALYGGLSWAGPEFATLLQEEPQVAMQRIGPIPSLLLWLGPINILLGVFNMVPGFPLDGGRVLRAALWWLTGDLLKSTLWAARTGRFFAFFLMAWGVMSMFTGAFFQGVWFLLIGWFLSNAARRSYEEVLIRKGLEGVPVSEIMRTHFESVTPEETIDTFIHHEVMGSDQQAFPVRSKGGAFLGLVSLDDIRKVQRESWPSTALGDVMTPTERLTTLPPDAPSDRVFQTLHQPDVDQVPIVDDERVVGLVRRQDLLRYLSLHLDESARRIDSNA